VIVEEGGATRFIELARSKDVTVQRKAMEVCVYVCVCVCVSVCVCECERVRVRVCLCLCLCLCLACVYVLNCPSQKLSRFNYKQ